MADYLGQSADRANQMTAQKLPYLQQAADFGSPLIRGAQAGMQMAGAAQEMALRQAEEERQQQTYAQRLTMVAAELDLRQRQAATQSLEMQTALQRAQNESVLFDLKKKNEEMQATSGKISLIDQVLSSDVMEMPDGTYSKWALNETGDPSFQEGLSATHPQVRDALRRRELSQKAQEADLGLKAARTMDYMRGGRSSRGSANQDSQVDPTKLLSMADALDKRADAVKELNKTSMTPEIEEEIATLRSKAGRARDAAMDGANLGEPKNKATTQGGMLSPSTMIMNAARMATAKVAFDKIPGLGAVDAQDLSKRAYGVGKGLKLMGQGWMKGADGNPRQATDDEMAQSIIQKLLDPEYPVDQRETLIDLIRSYGQ